mmetsp:Transcript_18842/g.49083  ORF Transcript_18842/g.49083 Transcript_18842/m.49083 type:complete len:323 (-) Transcript_18842:2-970(-)
MSQGCVILGSIQEAWVEVAGLEGGEELVPGASRGALVTSRGEVLVGEGTASQGPIAQQADIVVGGRAGFSKLLLKVAVAQAEVVLDGDGLRDTQLPGSLDHTAHTICGLVTQAPVLDLALLDELAHGRHSFLNVRRSELPLVLILRAVLPLPPQRCIAVRPVQLVQVKVVSLQAAQACLNSCSNVGPVHARARAWGKRIASPICSDKGSVSWCLPSNLGGQNDLIPAASGLHPVANVHFCTANCFWPRWHWIQFCCVNEVQALGQEVVHLCPGFLLRVLLAPGHCAQADLRHLQVGISQLDFGNGRHDEAASTRHTVYSARI